MALYYYFSWISLNGLRGEKKILFSKLATCHKQMQWTILKKLKGHQKKKWDKNKDK